MKTVVEDPGCVADRIGFLLQEASEDFPIRLHVNADGLVMEYNDKERRHKHFQKICTLTKNNS
jgi:hypothetical protein